MAVLISLVLLSCFRVASHTLQCTPLQSNTTTTMNSMPDNQSITNDFSMNLTFHHDPVITHIKTIIYSHIIRYICILGLVGNLLNLLVLTRKSLTTHMERLERSAHTGLIALAVSDFLFCLCVLPRTLQPPHVYEYSSQWQPWLLYELYSNTAINTFLLTSTWLTVVMAIARYLAICYPLRARGYLGIKAARTAICLVYICSLLFNLPRFWMNIVQHEECQEGWLVYFSNLGPMETSQTAKLVYRWLYFVLGIVAPLLVLMYCNIYLIKALQRSTQLRRRATNSKMDPASSSKNIVTLTLIIIVIFYIVLVSPAEILAFWETWVMDNFSSPALVNSYSVALSVCNGLQALNFAINFVLYCIINVHFRKVIHALITCSLLREQLGRQSSPTDQLHEEYLLTHK